MWLELPTDSTTVGAFVNPGAHPTTSTTMTTSTTTPTTTPTKRPASPKIEGESPAKRQKAVVTLSPVQYPAEKDRGHSTILLGPAGFGAFGLGNQFAQNKLTFIGLDTKENCLFFLEDVEADIIP